MSEEINYIQYQLDVLFKIVYRNYHAPNDFNIKAIKGYIISSDQNHIVAMFSDKKTLTILRKNIDTIREVEDGKN